MTTAFELAATNVYQPWNINQVGQAYAVYNAHSRVSAVREVGRTAPAALQPDTVTFSGTSALLAAAIPQEDPRVARLEALRQSIADGTYDISSSRVAGSLLQSLL